MNIYITLDYELYMGKETGTVSNCLITPISYLMEMLDRYEIKAVIFVDAAYLLRLYQLRDNSSFIAQDFYDICIHLKQLSASGHNIELHFHPQWLYSDFDNTQRKWIVDFEHYKLSDMSDEDVFKYFKQAKRLLDSIISRKTTVFRAGGYSLNSFRNYIKLFRDNGITIDSSVCGKKREKGKFQSYDYSNTPNKSKWQFSKDVCQSDDNGAFEEIPISSIKMMSLIYLTRKKIISMKHPNNIKWGDGKSIDSMESSYNKLFKKIRELFSCINVRACFDGYMGEFIPIIYDQLYKEGKQEMVIIGHPKGISQESISVLESFIKNTMCNNSYRTFLQN